MEHLRQQHRDLAMASLINILDLLASVKMASITINAKSQPVVRAMEDTANMGSRLLRTNRCVLSQEYPVSLFVATVSPKEYPADLYDLLIAPYVPVLAAIGTISAAVSQFSFWCHHVLALLQFYPC